jgi:hypothetical protein
MGDLFTAESFDGETLKYRDYLKRLPPRPLILSLGPCTVSSDLLRFAVEPELIMMAGCVKAGPNYKGLEFNQALDVNAYNAQVGYPHALAALDTARVPGFNLAAARFRRKGLLFTLLNRAVELAEKRHKDNSYVYDLIAALYLIIPDIFSVISTTDTLGNSVNLLSLEDGAFRLSDYLDTL